MFVCCEMLLAAVSPPLGLIPLVKHSYWTKRKIHHSRTGAQTAIKHSREKASITSEKRIIQFKKCWFEDCQ